MPRLARGKAIFLRFDRRPPLSDRVFGVFVQRTGGRPPKAPPLGATATTAASGGNREELLGQRPAGCKRQRSRRWEPQPGLGAKRLRGQARHERTAHAAISRLFVRAMLSLRPRITVSILALSVTCGDTSPKGRGFVRTGKVCKNCKNPLQTFPRCGIIHLAASPLEIEYLPL